MGTEVTVIAADTPETASLIGAGRDLFSEQESRFSRFRADSELSEVNSGAVHRCSPAFQSVLRRAMAWHSVTGGDFDPAVLPVLSAAGYGVTFERITTQSAKPGDGLATTPGRRPVFADIISDDGFQHVQLPVEVQIDLSGIVKGWTVDRAAELLSPLGHFVVDAGGDIYAHGDSPDCEGWFVGLEDPRAPGTDHSYVLIENSSVATSGTYRRRWQPAAGTPAHHLIDPRTGAPADDRVMAVSVIGPSTETCEVYAKAALIRGPEQGLALLETTSGLSGIMTLADGSTLRTADWQGLDAYRARTVAEADAGAANA